MNPLLLLFLGLGGLMSFSGFGGSSGTSSTTTAATLPDDTDTPDDSPEAPETPDTQNEPVEQDPAPEAPADNPTPPEVPSTGDEEEVETIALTMVIYDMADRNVVSEVSDGDSLDFGSDPVENYTFAVESDNNAAIGSVILSLNGQSWLQNVYPFTLEDSPLDLADGTFDIEVTVYSGPNGTGDVLGSEALSFATTSDAPVAEEDDEVSEEVVVEEPVEQEPDTPADTEEPDTQNEPEEPDAPEASEPLEIVDDTPTPPEQSGDGGAGGETEPLSTNGTVKVVAGRVATLEPEDDDIVDIKITSDLNHGKVTVNPDNTFAVVLTLSDKESDQSFTYEATHADGSTSAHRVNLDVRPGQQDQGWGTGKQHYMLATDENDDVVVETGDNHTKVYVSGSNNALSRADIANIEGVSVNQVNGAFMEARGYGQSENLALDTDAGMELWTHVTPRGSTTSNWLLFERGYEYEDVGRPLEWGISGESELHPVYMGAWGEGDKPALERLEILGDERANVVIQGLELNGALILDSNNFIFDDISIRDDEMVIQRVEGVTVRNTDIFDAYYSASKNGGNFEVHGDRIQGLFSNHSDGVLVDGVVLDQNGWDPNYEDGSGQAPSMFSHSLYFGANMGDVTIRDTISMRGASFGFNFRPGGFLEDNVILDNNAALSNAGGDHNNAGPIGNYFLMTDNVVTSAGHKESEQIGSLTWGISDGAQLSSLVDNIVAHLADPNNPDEIAEKWNTSFGVNENDNRYYDDTIVWNWTGSGNTTRDPEQNYEGLDPDVLDQTTIQLFTAQLLGQETATIDDLANYLRAQANGELDDVVDADLIIRFFQEGFGIAADIRTEAETLRFVPNDLGDGVRWDNRLNWTTEDLPGTINGDSVGLGGNTVIFNGNAEIDEMEFGRGGRLELYGGKLTTGLMTTAEAGAEAYVTEAGQLWADGHAGLGLDIEVDGGRFVNTGALSDVELTASGGQTVLATGGAIYGVSNGETLSVIGDQKIGFDDEDGGVALLALEDGGTLHFDAENGKIATIEEFRTGAMDDAPDVRSGIDLGNGTLKIDLAGLSASNGEVLKLLDADEIIGAFDNADILGLGGRNATITINYVTDAVSLTLSNGNGNVLFETIGQADDVSAGEQALWDALTAGHGVFDESTPDPEIPEDEVEYLAAS